MSYGAKTGDGSSVAAETEWSRSSLGRRPGNDLLSEALGSECKYLGGGFIFLYYSFLGQEDSHRTLRRTERIP